MRYSKFSVSKAEFISLAIMLYSLGIAILLRNIFPMALNWFGIIFAVCSIYSWKSKTGESIFSLYTIFIFFFVAFNYGVPIMWALGIHKETEFGNRSLFYTGYIPSQKDIIETQVYTCICMVIFHIGALITSNRKSKTKIKQCTDIERHNDDTILMYSLKTVSLVLLTLEAPLAIGYAVYSYTISRVWGYKALYYGDYQVQSGYIPMLLYFFFPSIVGYMIGNRYSRKSRIIGYTIFAVYTVINILAGDRGSWVYSLAVLIWLHTQYRKISVRKLFGIAFVGLIGLYVLQAIISIRDVGIGNVTTRELVELIDIRNFPIFNAFFEMGGSMGIIMYLLHVGNGIYPYTNTYLTSILGAVSTRLLNLFDQDVVLLGDWFSQSYLHLSYGAGFSMIGEAYVNGGYVGGLVYLLILGMLLGKLIGYSKRNFIKNYSMRLFFMAAGLNAIIGLIRGALYLTLKQFIWGVGIYSLLILVFYKILKKRNSVLQREI